MFDDAISNQYHAERLAHIEKRIAYLERQIKTTKRPYNAGYIFFAFGWIGATVVFSKLLGGIVEHGLSFLSTLYYVEVQLLVLCPIALTVIFLFFGWHFGGRINQLEEARVPLENEFNELLAFKRFYEKEDENEEVSGVTKVVRTESMGMTYQHEKMRRNPLKLLIYLFSALLILLGVDFILANLGIINSIFAIPGLSSAHQAWSWFDAYLLSALMLIPTIGMLYWLIQRSKREKTAVETLCKNLKLMGLNATLESREQKVRGGVIGAVRVANRSIDLVELELMRYYSDEFGPANSWRCNFIVQAKVEGLEDRLKAEGKPVTAKKGFLSSEIVDFEWEGKELAQMLNSDTKLRDTLYRMKNVLKFSTATYVRAIEIEPYREHQCIKIRQRFPAYYDVYAAFPTAEAFEAFDRIAQHIRSIANTPSNT